MFRTISTKKSTNIMMVWPTYLNSNLVTSLIVLFVSKQNQQNLMLDTLQIQVRILKKRVKISIQVNMMMGISPGIMIIKGKTITCCIMMEIPRIYTIMKSRII